MRPQKCDIIILSFAITIAALTGCNLQQKEESIVVAPASGEAMQPATTNKIGKIDLVGEWTRTDAPYQLKITGLGDEGNLSVEYFNPKAIHIGKSGWKDTAGTIKVYIEMQDVNYPGSRYSLLFVPGKNLLTGTYFQAVEGETYEVDFIRTK